MSKRKMTSIESITNESNLEDKEDMQLVLQIEVKDCMFPLDISFHSHGLCQMDKMSQMGMENLGKN